MPITLDGTAGITTPSLLNANANGVGNIGTSIGYWNTIFAKATSAQYADLAEMYESDSDAEPGTVMMFGGTKEVAICYEDSSTAVAGVVSTNPSYVMNAGQEGEHVLPVALVGRVPTKVVGSVKKGDLMVAAGNGAARAESSPALGSVIGKSIENFDGLHGVIEIVVGKI